MSYDPEPDPEPDDDEEELIPPAEEPMTLPATAMTVSAPAAPQFNPQQPSFDAPPPAANGAAPQFNPQAPSFDVPPVAGAEGAAAAVPQFDPTKPSTDGGRARITVYDNHEDQYGSQSAAVNPLTGKARSQEGVTIAVDPAVIPYGSQVRIPKLAQFSANGDGIFYAHDTGGAVKSRQASGGTDPVIDVYVEGSNATAAHTKRDLLARALGSMTSPDGNTPGDSTLDYEIVKRGPGAPQFDPNAPSTDRPVARDSEFWPSLEGAAQKDTRLAIASGVDALTPPTYSQEAQAAKQRLDAINGTISTLQAKKAAGTIGLTERLDLAMAQHALPHYQETYDQAQQAAQTQPDDVAGPMGKTAQAARDAAAGAFAQYGADEASPNLAAQVGRGVGHVAATVPAAAAPGIGLPAMVTQMAGQAYEGAYAQEQQRQAAAGVTDAQAIAQAAEQAGSAEAVKQLPALAAYMVGGKLASAAVQRLLPAASPIMRGLAGAGAGTVANVASGTVIRAAQGAPLMPTAESLTQDALFGAMHGYGEYAHAQASPVSSTAGTPRFDPSQPSSDVPEVKSASGLGAVTLGEGDNRGETAARNAPTSGANGPGGAVTPQFDPSKPSTDSPAPPVTAELKAKLVRDFSFPAGLVDYVTREDAQRVMGSKDRQHIAELQIAMRNATAARKAAESERNASNSERSTSESERTAGNTPAETDDETVPFSKTDELAEAEQTMRATYAAAGHKAVPSIRMVHGPADLPESPGARQVRSAVHKGALVEAYYDPKTRQMTVLLDGVKRFAEAKGLTTEQRLQELALHEIVHHYGTLDSLFPKDAKGSYQRIVDGLIERMDPADLSKLARLYNYDPNTVEGRRDLAEEYLARFNEREGQQAPGFVAKAFAALRDLVRRVYPDLRWTDADVRALLDTARKSAAEARESGGAVKMAMHATDEVGDLSDEKLRDYAGEVRDATQIAEHAAENGVALRQAADRVSDLVYNSFGRWLSQRARGMAKRMSLEDLQTLGDRIHDEQATRSHINEAARDAGLPDVESGNGRSAWARDYEARTRQIEQSLTSGAGWPREEASDMVPDSWLPSQRELDALDAEKRVPAPAQAGSPQPGGMDRIVEAFKHVAASEKTWQFPKELTGKTAEEIGQQISTSKRQITGQTIAPDEIRFKSARGQLSADLIHGKDWQIHGLRANSEGEQEGGGTQLYQAMLAWMHNNGQRAVPDEGLTHINSLRRTSNMLSSALRFGSTDHMLPDHTQNVAWTGSHADKIGSLAYAEADKTLRYFPDLAKLTIDPETLTVRDHAGQPVDNAEINRIIERADAQHARGVGVATAKRALLVRSAALLPGGGEFTRKLGDALLQSDQRGSLERVFYSQHDVEELAKGEDDDQKRRAFIDSVKESPEIATPVKEKIESLYTPITNRETVEAAKAHINDVGIEKALAEVMGKSDKNPPTALSNAQAIELLGRLNTAGRYDEAGALAEHVAATATSQGQAIQALSLLAKLTPEGIDVYARRVIQKGVDAAGGKGDVHRDLLDQISRLKAELAKAKKNAATRITVDFNKELAKLPGLDPQKAADLAGKLRDALVVAADQPGIAVARIRGLLIGAGMDREKATRLADRAIAEVRRQTKANRDKLLEQMLKVKIPGNKVPPGMINKLRVLNETGALNDATMFDAIAKKFGLPVFTAHDAAKIRDLQKQYDATPPGDRKLLAGARMLQAIHELVPSDLWTKANATRNMVMLLNPKTVMRIVGGNTVLWAADVAADSFNRWVIDPAVSIFTGSRVRRSVDVGTRLQGLAQPARDWWNGYTAAREAGASKPGAFAQGVQDMIDLARLTSAGKSDAAQVTDSFRHVFSNRFGKMMEDGIALLHGVPHRAFNQAAFQASLARQMTVERARTGVPMLAPTPEMVAEARADAARASFLDETALSKGLKQVRSGLNVASTLGATDKFGLGSILLPFVHVPGSIIAREAEFSPLGLVNVIHEIGRPLFGGKFNQKRFGESLSRLAVGSSVMAAGYFLAKLGIISGAPDEDRDLETFRKNSGTGGYRINLSELRRRMMSGDWHTPATLQDSVQPGDVLVNYDWLHPNAMALGAGANVGELGSKASWSSGFIAAGKTMEEQPMLSGLLKFFGDYHDNGLTGSLIKLALGSASSFEPVLMDQAKQLTDNQVRETRAGSMLDQAKAQVLAKMPWIEQRFPPRYDVFGEAQKKYGYGANSIFNVLINPSNITQFTGTPVTKELDRLYRYTGSGAVLPKSAPRSVQINGQPLELTNDQISQYQRFVGQTSMAVAGRLLASPVFARLPDDVKAKYIGEVLNNSAVAAKILLFGDRYNTNKTTGQPTPLHVGPFTPAAVQTGRGVGLLGPVR